jgi:hypothetical protein
MGRRASFDAAEKMRRAGWPMSFEQPVGQQHATRDVKHNTMR